MVVCLCVLVGMAQYILDNRDVDIDEAVKHYDGICMGVWKLFIERGVDKSKIDIGTRFTQSRLKYSWRKKAGHVTFLKMIF